MLSTHTLLSALFALTLLTCVPLFATIRHIQLWWNGGASTKIRRTLGEWLLYVTRKSRIVHFQRPEVKESFGGVEEARRGPCASRSN